MNEKECLECKRTFKKLASTSRRVWALQKYCSIKCSKTLIKPGAPLPKYIKDGMDGSIRKQVIHMMGGSRNANWRGGKSYAFLKKVVLLRDNWTCVMCGHREQAIMEVDHVKPKSEYPELAKEVTNLVTLCPNCHRRKSNREMIERGQNPHKQFAVVKGY